MNRTYSLKPRIWRLLGHIYLFLWPFICSGPYFDGLCFFVGPVVKVWFFQESHGREGVCFSFQRLCLGSRSNEQTKPDLKDSLKETTRVYHFSIHNFGYLKKCYEGPLTLFFPMFPFDCSENIRTPNISYTPWHETRTCAYQAVRNAAFFLMFLVGSKGNIWEKRFKNTLKSSLENLEPIFFFL